MALITIKWRPEPKQLRNFGLAASVFLGAAGAWIRVRHSFWHRPIDPTNAHTISIALFATTGVFFLIALTAPRILRPLYVALMAATFPIGFVMSYVILFVLFYLVFLPLGLIIRATGGDLLRRNFDRHAKTYWVARPPIKDPRRYFRQY